MRAAAWLWWTKQAYWLCFHAYRNSKTIWEQSCLLGFLPRYLLSAVYGNKPNSMCPSPQYEDSTRSCLLRIYPPACVSVCLCVEVMPDFSRTGMARRPLPPTPVIRNVAKQSRLGTLARQQCRITYIMVHSGTIHNKIHRLTLFNVA